MKYSDDATDSLIRFLYPLSDFFIAHFAVLKNHNSDQGTDFALLELFNMGTTVERNSGRAF